MQLFRAIAARDRALVSRLLESAPELAREALKVGASRAEASDYFFDSIAHYAYSGDTALHMASAAHDVVVARELVKRGANLRARNRRGAEPLHYATDGAPGSVQWDPDAQLAIVRFLIEAGADPRAETKDGVAPIHRAVRTRSASAVRALLEAGVEPRVKNRTGSTPLHLAVQDTGRGGSGSAAAREQQTRIIQLLLEHGARSSDRNSAGKSVADYVRADWILALFAGESGIE